jgi:hypothetical protein
MLRHLTDEHLDAIVCEPLAQPHPEHPVCRIAGTNDDVLRPMLTFQVWSHLRSFAESLAAGWGAAYDEWGFEYDHEREPWEEPYNGVRVFVPRDEVVVGTDAFERLMARYYAAILETASIQRLAVRDEPWWPQFTENVSALSARVAPPA